MKRYEGSGAGEIGMTLEGASSLDRSVEMWVLSEHGEVSVESGACEWQQLVMEITSPQAGSRLEKQNLEIINTSCFLALLRGLGDCWQFYTNPRQTFSKECH